MKKKKGFTLIELLGVLAIIGVISFVAIPNIINITDGSKKDAMIDDAKKFISLAKVAVSNDANIRSSYPYFLYLRDIDTKGDIKISPDGDEYDEESYVIYNVENNTASYCVYLKAIKRYVGYEGQCIQENVLYSRNNVQDINSALQ